MENEIKEAKPVLQEAGEAATAMAQKAGSALSQKWEQSRNLVKKHPVESMLVGFGLGCLVGLCLRRRK